VEELGFDSLWVFDRLVYDNLGSLALLGALAVLTERIRMGTCVLLPLALYINWRLAILLFVLCVVFTVLTTLVVRKTYGMQSEVESHYSDLSARASDALGNVALVQSFVRIDAEVQGLRFVADKLLAVQMPVLSWWALVTVITRASTTITVLAIFTVGIVLHQEVSPPSARS